MKKVKDITIIDQYEVITKNYYMSVKDIAILLKKSINFVRSKYIFDLIDFVEKKHNKKCMYKPLTFIQKDVLEFFNIDEIYIKRKATEYMRFNENKKNTPVE